MRPLVAKFYVVKRILAARLEREYTPGDRLPSETDLCAEFGVSRITVQQALRLLEREGIIRREQGRGTFFLGVPGRRIDTAPGGFLDAMTREGDALRVVGSRTVAAPPQVAARLGVAPGAPVVIVDRVAYLDGAPIALASVYLTHALGTRLLDHVSELTRARIVTVLEGRCGVEIGVVRQRITATLADPSYARVLDIEVGAPVLETERLFLDREGRPVFASQVFSRADRHRLVVDTPS